MSVLVNAVTAICLVVISISIVMVLYRVIKGPSHADRAVALDAIGIHLIAMTGLLAVAARTTVFHDIILLIGIITFIGTISLAKFLEKGVVIDRDRH